MRLIDLADLRAAEAPALVAEVAAVEEVIDTELARYRRWAAARGVGPALRRMRADAEEVARQEVARADVPEEDRAALERAVLRTVHRLTHATTREMLAAAEAGDGALVERLAGLYAPAARSAADDPHAAAGLGDALLGRAAPRPASIAGRRRRAARGPGPRSSRRPARGVTRTAPGRCSCAAPGRSDPRGCGSNPSCSSCRSAASRRPCRVRASFRVSSPSISPTSPATSSSVGRTAVGGVAGQRGGHHRGGQRVPGLRQRDLEGPLRERVDLRRAAGAGTDPAGQPPVVDVEQAGLDHAVEVERGQLDRDPGACGLPPRDRPARADRAGSGRAAAGPARPAARPRPGRRRCSCVPLLTPNCTALQR